MVPEKTIDSSSLMKSTMSIPLAKGMDMVDFIKELESIVFSGTKLNIDYWIDETFDEDQQEEIHDYFMESESDSIQDAIEEFDGRQIPQLHLE